MKVFMAAFAVFCVASTNVLAGVEMKCVGTKENKGARAEAVFGKASFRLSGEQLFSGSRPESVDCQGKLDRGYKPRTPDPRYVRFNIENWDPHGSCRYRQAFVSKDLLQAGRGYVDLVVECGHPGDFCDASYFCKIAE